MSPHPVTGRRRGRPDEVQALRSRLRAALRRGSRHLESRSGGPFPRDRGGLSHGLPARVRHLAHRGRAVLGHRLPQRPEKRDDLSARERAAVAERPLPDVVPAAPQLLHGDDPELLFRQGQARAPAPGEEAQARRDLVVGMDPRVEPRPAGRRRAREWFHARRRPLPARPRRSPRQEARGTRCHRHGVQRAQVELRARLRGSRWARWARSR